MSDRDPLRPRKTPTPLCSCPEKAEKNGPAFHDRLQLILQRKTSGVSKTPPPSNNAVPREHGRSLQTNQKHLPHATGTIEK